MRSSAAVVTPGRTAARIRSCISATTCPAARIVCSSAVRAARDQAPHQGRTLVMVRTAPAAVDGGDHAVGHLVGRTHAIDHRQQSELAVVVCSGVVWVS